jgi:uncharacterized NAD-dependent epimerase/dehydratase family protein
VSRERIDDGRDQWLAVPPLTEYVRWYEAIGSAVHPTRVVGISLNTYDLDEPAARAACDAATRATGLPATDPVRFDPAPLLDAVAAGREHHRRERTRQPG